MLQSDDLGELKKWKCGVRKAKKVNQERHSQRCDIELKLSVVFYFLFKIIKYIVAV